MCCEFRWLLCFTCSCAESPSAKLEHLLSAGSMYHKFSLDPQGPKLSRRGVPNVLMPLLSWFSAFTKYMCKQVLWPLHDSECAEQGSLSLQS